VISGNPNSNRICTSQIERQNLTIRMQIRRLTRLTNGFNKKYENHKAAIALPSPTTTSARSSKRFGSRLRRKQRSPDHVWTIAELVA
jgi:hypothetical protein